MKKAVNWIYIASIVVFVIVWGVLGLNIYNGNYDITTEAYLGGGCIILMAVCAVYRLLTDKCPHCGKIRQIRSAYCPHCGTKM